MNLNARAITMIVVAAVLGAVLGGGVGYYLASTSKPYYRAEMTLALLPGPGVTPDQISNYWEALSRGQAPRIAAEVLNQKRWIEPAAKAAGFDADSIGITAGVVTDTTLITVGGEAPSAAGAEAAATAAVTAATPLAQSVSGPFVLQVVQPAEGTAKSLTTPPGQTIAVATLAGLVVGAGLGFLVARRRPAAVASRPGQPSSPHPVPAAPVRSAPPQNRPGPPRQAMPPGQGQLRPGAAPVLPRPDR
jgi:hypothetical protein